MLLRERVILIILSGLWVACCNTLWKIPNLLQHQDYAAIAHRFVPRGGSDGDAAGAKDSAPQVLITREDSEGMVSTVGGGSVRVNVGNWQNEHNIVHVVHTRFMQRQPNLLHLGGASLELFKTFTLSSILHQSNKQFLWLIWTDLHLHRDVRRELVRLVSKFPNAIVLGADDTGQDFRSLNGLYLPEFADTIMAGDQKLLLDYYAASQTRLLVESHLDTGDALAKNYAESVQAQAVATVGRSVNPRKVEILCVEDHLEWMHHKRSEEDFKQGKLVQYHDRDFCVNTGLSFVYGVQASARQLKILEQTSVLDGFDECLPEVVEKEEDECLGQGLPVVKYDSFDLHRGSCPDGSVFCRGDNGGKEEFCGPYFSRRSEVIECKVDGTASDTILASVSTTKIKNDVPSGLDIVVDGDYVMAAIYIKGGPGGHLFTWDWDGASGGAKSGHFFSPDGNAIGHVDMCVIPKATVCKKPPPKLSFYSTNTELVRRRRKLNGSERKAQDIEPNDQPPKRQNECRRKIQMVDDDTRGEHRYIRNAVLLSNTPPTVTIRDMIPRKYRKEHVVAEKTFESKELQNDAFSVMEHDFGASIEKVINLRHKLDDDMENILQDAIAGYCANLYSCKESTRQMLLTLLKKVRHYKLRKGLALAEQTGEDPSLEAEANDSD